jgi:hypothetical protein
MEHAAGSIWATAEPILDTAQLLGCNPLREPRQRGSGRRMVCRGCHADSVMGQA